MASQTDWGVHIKKNRGSLGKVGGGWMKEVIGVWGYPYHDEHWGMNGNIESLYCTPEN